jgi:hypothetical protein
MGYHARGEAPKIQQEAGCSGEWEKLVVVFTVTKPIGTKDREFEAYTRLLEDVGIDVSNSYCL